jgi:UDP-N-acetylglucosamine:LPS N-acetylglucosamine transferase
LAKAGAACALGSAESASVEELARAIAALLANPQRVIEMSERAAKLVDGRGAERVLEAVLGSTDCSQAVPATLVAQR